MHRLSLAIGIAGKLVHEMGVTDNWEGVVELLQQEFADSGQDRSMEEHIIRTSLAAIKGVHRDKILRLFNAFAIVPEDTQLPIDMVAMLFEAENETPLDKPPSVLNIRRWLKFLIDRSLILGTVDRPSLHGELLNTPSRRLTHIHHSLLSMQSLLWPLLAILIFTALSSIVHTR